LPDDFLRVGVASNANATSSAAEQIAADEHAARMLQQQLAQADGMPQAGGVYVSSTIYHLITIYSMMCSGSGVTISNDKLCANEHAWTFEHYNC
jgi:hypothetical protein